MQLNLQKGRGFLPRISKNRYRISASEILLKSVNLCSKSLLQYSYVYIDKLWPHLDSWRPVIQFNKLHVECASSENCRIYVSLLKFTHEASEISAKRNFASMDTKFFASHVGQGRLSKER